MINSVLKAIDAVEKRLKQPPPAEPALPAEPTPVVGEPNQPPAVQPVPDTNSLETAPPTNILLPDPNTLEPEWGEETAPLEDPWLDDPNEDLLDTLQPVPAYAEAPYIPQ